MKLLLKNTASGLVPMYDVDYEEKRKLKIGETYNAEIKKQRNPEFHRKFFALINCTWDVLPDAGKEFFKTTEGLRKYLTVTAGHFDLVYSNRLKEFVEIPKSISFENMDNTEFQDLYNNVVSVIFSMVLKGRITEEQFNNHLANF